MIIKLSRDLFQKYNQFVIKYPLIGMSVTSGVGMSAGNLICQLLTIKPEKRINIFQIIQYGVFGLLISGPVLRYWWYALDLKIFANPNIKLRPVKMMLLDQATTPYLLNGMFLYFLSKTDGETETSCQNNVQKNLLPVVFESYKFWPLATLLNFYVIPLHNRVLFSNVVAILWATYLTALLAPKDE